MPRPHRFSEKQIVLALKQVESGELTVDRMCERMQINRRTYYKWRAKFEGLNEDEVTRFRQLQEENNKLKHLVADLTLDVQALRVIVSKKY